MANGVTYKSTGTINIHQGLVYPYTVIKEHHAMPSLGTTKITL
jgi:hypothetical protein